MNYLALKETKYQMEAEEVKSPDYTPREIKQIKKFRSKGMSDAQMSGILGRPIQSIYAKVNQLKKRGLLDEKPTQEARTYKPRKIKKKVDVLPTTVSKPMIALVGSREEVSATLRELFS